METNTRSERIKRRWFSEFWLGDDKQVDISIGCKKDYLEDSVNRAKYKDYTRRDGMDRIL